MRTVFLNSRPKLVFLASDYERNIETFRTLDSYVQLLVLKKSTADGTFFEQAIGIYLERPLDTVLIDQTCELILAQGRGWSYLRNDKICRFASFALRSGPSDMVFRFVLSILDYYFAQLARLAQSSGLIFLSSRFSYHACYVLLLYYKSQFSLVNERQMLAVVRRIGKSRYWMDFLWLLRDPAFEGFAHDYLQACVEFGNGQQLSDLLYREMEQLSDHTADELRFLRETVSGVV